MKTTLAISLALFAGSLATAEAQNRVLLLPGETLPGAGTITQVGEFAMNSHGSWVGLVQTDLPTPTGYGVLVRDGQPVLVPDGVNLAPAFTAPTFFLDLDDQGNIGYTAVDPATGDWHLMRNTTTLLKRGEAVDIDGDGATEPVIGFRAVHLSKDGSGAIYAVLQAGPQHSLVRLWRQDTGQLESQVVLPPGQVLPTGAVVSGFDYWALRFRSQLDSNAAGDLAFGLRTKGVYRYSLASGTLAAVAKHGDPSPFANGKWDIDIFQSIALSDTDSVFFPNRVSGSGQSLHVLAQNQQALFFEGQPLQFPSGQSVGGVLTTGSVRVSPKGEVLWGGTFQGADGNPRPGLARDGKVVVLGGTTRVEGHTIGEVVLSVDGGHNFTADGERILFRGRTVNGLIGLFEVRTTPTVEVIPGCVPKFANLAPFGSTTGLALGQVFQPILRLTQPQGDGALPLLLVSPLGTGGCGTLVPGVGELLVGLQPDLLLVSAPAASLGNDALFVFPGLPQSLAFQGLSIYAQGLWVDTLSPFEPVRVSNAMRYVVGL